MSETIEQRAAQVMRDHYVVTRYRGSGTICACGVKVRQLSWHEELPDWPGHYASALVEAGLLKEDTDV